MGIIKKNGMRESVYDPTLVVGDAFDMDNMAEGTSNKILTAAERTILSNTSNTNTGDQIASTVTYDNTASELTATNVKTAIDETALQSKMQNSGTVVEPSYTDNGDGTVTIGTGTYRFYDNINWTGYIQEIEVTGGTFTITNSIIQLTYIYADYNSGTPEIKITNNLADINGVTTLPIYTCTRSGVAVCKLAWNGYGNGVIEKAFIKDVAINRFDQVPSDKLTLGETGTRNVTVSPGKVYYGTKIASLLAVDTTTDNIQFLYHVAGVWTCSTINQYNNTQYDNGTNLTTLTSNRYAVNWVYRNVDADKEQVCIVLGTGDYTIAGAEESLPPTPPVSIVGVCVYVGRIIVQKGDNTAYSIEQATTTPTGSVSVTNHNDLDNIQLAANSITYGHIDDQAQTIYGSKTFDSTIVGDISGNAGTVSTITGLAPDTATTQATQPNITSLGTLTGLDVAGEIAGIKINTLGISQSATTGTTYPILTLVPESVYEVRIFEEGAPISYLLATVFYSTYGQVSYQIQHSVYSITLSFSGTSLLLSHNAGVTKQLSGTITRLL